ncbi:MAG: HYR domain-containing protein, partial [Nitrososphaeraceae archaeon]
FSGSCSGVSGEGGLLVVLPDQTNEGLVRITASLQENRGTGIINQQEKSKEQTGSDFDPSSGFIGFATVDTDRISYNYGETITVSGKLSQPDRGTKVRVSVTDPLGQIVSQSRLVTTSSGEFQTVTTIPVFHPVGQYTVSIYNDKGTFLGDAKFTVQSTLTTTEDDFSQELPDYGKVVNLNKYDNDEFGFSIGYPQGWDLDDSYVEPVENPGIFDLTSYPVGFYNDIDAWEAYFEVKYVVNDNAAKSYRGSQYLDKLIDILREDCKLVSFEIDGFICSNHSIVDSKIIKINGKTAYQVTESSISTYPDVEYDRDIRIVTDIPVGNDVWTIDTTATASEYPKFANVIHSSINSFTIWESGVKPSQVQDNVPPLIMAPSNMVVDADDQFGSIVDYSVKAIDNVDGMVTVFCTPSPSSYFQIGETKVVCNSQDSSGNQAEKSFMVTVGTKLIVIPEWIKNVAGFWCNNEIEDSSFVEAIQYLIKNKLIIVSTTSAGSMASDEIPKWIKNNACWWTENQISDNDFASGLEYLIQKRIIRI